LSNESVHKSDTKIFSPPPPPIIDSESIPPAQLDDDYDEQALLLSKEIRDHVVLADEALVDVVQHSMPLILTAEVVMGISAKKSSHLSLPTLKNQ
jgi:hypothetical protein